jgi:hypothetical protein
MNDANEIMISVTYGLGATARALVAREALKGWTVREVIEAAIKAPRAPGSPEERAAVVLAEALRSRRPLDAELSLGPSEGMGQPVALDEAIERVLSQGGRSGHTERLGMEQELRVSLSEPYRGGGRR